MRGEYGHRDTSGHARASGRGVYGRSALVGADFTVIPTPAGFAQQFANMAQATRSFVAARKAYEGWAHEPWKKSDLMATMNVAYARTQDLGVELDLGDIEDDGMARWESKMLAKAADYESKSRWWIEQARAQERASHPAAKPPPPKPSAPAPAPPRPTAPPAAPVPPVVSTVPAPAPSPAPLSEARFPSPTLKDETRSLIKVGLIGTAAIAGIFLVSIVMSKAAR